MTAQDLRQFEMIDEIVPEPSGAAHAEPTLAAALLDSVLKRQLQELWVMGVERRLQERYMKFRKMGRFAEIGA